jgi:enamine deaminase RidA (YjgF/YER057c/UK114 family)
MIQRIPGSAAGRSAAVVHGGFVFTVATAGGSTSTSLAEQTRAALKVLDQRLAQAGTDKSRLLSATVYITDMARKGEMDAEWSKWVDPNNPPQRACIGVAALAGSDLVEIVAIAAAKA